MMRVYLLFLDILHHIFVVDVVLVVRIIVIMDWDSL